MEQQLFTQMHELETKHWWFLARRKVIKKVLNTFMPTDKNRQVLEIGCGTGGNLDLLSHFGIVSATELDDQARQLAVAKSIATVKSGSLPNDIPYQQHFNLICLLDVLEHIEDDGAAIAKLATLLAAEGKLLITVPAYQWLWSSHDTLHHHKRRYTKKQLTQLLETHGFQILYSSYFNSLLFPLIFMVRKLAAWLKKNNDSDATMPSIAINTLLGFIFGCERYLIPTLSLPFGVSIIAVAAQHTQTKG